MLVASSNTDQTAIADQLADGRIWSHVSQTLPFDRLPDAMQLVESGQTKGKEIVTC